MNAGMPAEWLAGGSSSSAPLTMPPAQEYDAGKPGGIFKQRLPAFTPLPHSVLMLVSVFGLPVHSGMSVRYYARLLPMQLRMARRSRWAPSANATSSVLLWLAPGADGLILPEAYAQHAQRWVAAGASIVGGCCGVGPPHIALLLQQLCPTKSA